MRTKPENFEKLNIRKHCSSDFFFFFFKIMTKLIWKKEEKKLSLAMERSEVHRRGKYDMLEE